MDVKRYRIGKTVNIFDNSPSIGAFLNAIVIAVPPDVVVPCAIDLTKQERNALERAIAPATLEH